MGKLVVTIRSNGEVETLLKDKVFDTRILGNRKIERLSEVLPTDDGSKFFVKWLAGPQQGLCVGYFDAYEEAVEYEVRIVNEARLLGHSYKKEIA